jgi:hypothetical protein
MSHLTPSTPSKFKLYFDISYATVLSEPALYIVWYIYTMQEL